MADAAPVITQSEPEPARGTTQVEDRVFDRVALAAVDEVPATRGAESLLSRVTGGKLPRIDIEHHPGGLYVVVDAGISWPASANAVATQVQQSVAQRLERITGAVVAGVTVRCHYVPGGEPQGKGDERS